MYVTFSRKMHTNGFLLNRQKLTANKQLVNVFSNALNWLANVLNRQGKISNNLHCTKVFERTALIFLMPFF